MPDRYEFEVGMNSGPLKQSLGDIGKMREAVGGLAATFGGPLVGQVGAAIGMIRQFGLAMMANPAIAILGAIAAAAKGVAMAMEYISETSWKAFQTMQAKASEYRKEVVRIREEYEKLSKTGRYAETATQKGIAAAEKAAEAGDVNAIDKEMAAQRERIAAQEKKEKHARLEREVAADTRRWAVGKSAIQMASATQLYEQKNAAFEQARLNAEVERAALRQLQELRTKAGKREGETQDRVGEARTRNEEAEHELAMSGRSAKDRLADLMSRRAAQEKRFIASDEGTEKGQEERAKLLEIDKALLQTRKELAQEADAEKKKVDDTRKARAEELQQQRQLLALRLEELRAGGVDASEKGAEAAAAKRKKAVEAELATLAKGMPDLMRQLQTEAATKRVAAATTAAEKTKALNDEVAKMSERSVRSIDWGEAFDIARGQSGETDPAQETATATKRLVELTEDVKKALAGGVK